MLILGLSSFNLFGQVNSNETIDLERSLFLNLSSENDSIAFNSFIQLTTCQPQKIIQLANEFEKTDFNKSTAIPSLPFRFLKQLVVLTDYCKKNNIDFVGTDELKEKIKKLNSNLSFSERRQLENNLINTLTLDEITSLEYWTLIKERSNPLCYSVGRILDIFYSRNWNKLIENDKQLRLYLKKSYLFEQLGSIGICNNYLKKFSNADSSFIQKLNLLQSDDPDIQQQLKKAKLIRIIEPKFNSAFKKDSKQNKDTTIIDIEKKIQNLIKSKNEEALLKLLSKINYNQIGVALNAIEKISFNNKWSQYSFMDKDWGFFLITDFSDINARKDFLKHYNELSEYDLYSYYLNLSGVDYNNNDNTLNYDKIYELLKYDIVFAFIGSINGTREDEVYSLIKLLEIKNNSTLGYSNKLCNSIEYKCSARDRANEWMQFIIDNNLLKEMHKEPISFHYE